jgi:hypothetical protein
VQQILDKRLRNHSRAGRGERSLVRGWFPCMPRV